MLQKIRRSLALPALTLMLSAFIAACAGSRADRHHGGPPEPPVPDKAAIARAEALSASGYRPLETQAVSLASQSWIVQGQALPVSLAFPVGSARGLPLIVYMPGLGETVQAGARWRQAWARAGYAVLGLQPLEADARAWSSELARDADFKGLARERQQPSQLQARVRGIKAALAEARRRAATGDPMWQRVDFNAVGFAGYELGTQAALSPDLALNAKALLAISPIVAALPATPEGTSARPTLLVSSRRDSDPTGLIDAPARLSSRAFEQLPEPAEDGPEHAMLLMLETATHATLAGSGGADPEAFADRPTSPVRGENASQDGPTGGGGGVHHRGGKGGNNMGARQDGTAGGRAAERSAGGPSDSSQEASAIIENSSVAFWDAYLRRRTQAREWLKDSADDWLKGHAELDLR